MQAKKVSILIPLYNAEKYIEDTIKSALEQTYNNIEIIVVDDSSTDKSYEIAKRYESSNVIVVQQKNKGPGAARNTALELSSGEYIQYLDADDLLDPTKIKKQMAIFSRLGDDIFVFGRLGIFRKSISNVKFHTAKYFKNYNDSIDFLTDYWGYGGMIQIASCLIPRKTILEVGKWNEELILNEDGEFISRLVKSSKKIIYLEESTTYYRKDNMYSLNSQRTRKHYESLLASFNLYTHLVSNNLNNDKLVLALAKLYTRQIYNMYPKYEDLRSNAQKKLFKLGFKGPLPQGHKCFALAVYIMGAEKALKLREFIKSIKK